MERGKDEKKEIEEWNEILWKIFLVVISQDFKELFKGIKNWHKVLISEYNKEEKWQEE